ncbi:hypothetical protein Tco_1253076 [Tanacetum coccineum]
MIYGTTGGYAIWSKSLVFLKGCSKISRLIFFGKETTRGASHTPPALIPLPFITSSRDNSPLEEGGDTLTLYDWSSLRGQWLASARLLFYLILPSLEAIILRVLEGVPLLVHMRKTDCTLVFLQEGSQAVTKGFELNDGRSCANMIDHFTPPAFFKTVRGMEHEQLFAEFNVSAARNLSLSFEVRMRAEYNILEKRKWRSLAEEKDSLLGAKDKEIEELRLQVASLESTVAEKDHELSDLEISYSSLRSQNQGLVSQVTRFGNLLTSCSTEQLDLYGPENMISRGTPPARVLYALPREFPSAPPQRRCRTEMALGNAFGRAIEKGMQEGLAAGIEHGQAGRCLTDLEAYIPSAEVDFNSVVRDLRGLNFPLLQELSNKKDASTWDVMDLLRLDDVVAEALGMTDLQPDVNQLMVPVHHKQDRVVIGSQALSVALDIYHPLSAEALIEPPVVVPATNALSTVVIVPHSGPSVSVEDYENPDLVDVVPENVTLGPEGEENIDASTVGDLAFSKLDDEAKDVFL